MKIILSEHNKNKIREELSELEHDQWMKWSKDIANEEDISKDRLDRWKKDWVDYKKLDEKTKDFDREWADKVINIIEKHLGKEYEYI
jgi:hypothetical protein